MATKYTWKDLREYIPKDRIVKLIEKHNVKYPKSADWDEVLQIVANAVKQSDLTELVEQYRFAGRCAVIWYTTEGGTDRFDKRSVINAISKHATNKVFDQEIRPKLSEEPQLNRAYEIGNGLVFLEFVFEGKPSAVAENYEVRTYRPTIRVNGCIRFGSLFVEARTSYHFAPKIAGKVFEILGGRGQKITLDDQELDDLIKKLKARLKIAKHKKNQGDYDTLEVTAAPTVEDLNKSKQYISDFQGEESRKKLIYFKHNTSLGEEEVSLEIRPQAGSFWFRSFANEDEIQHVFQKVREVKGI